MQIFIEEFQAEKNFEQKLDWVDTISSDMSDMSRFNHNSFFEHPRQIKND